MAAKSNCFINWIALLAMTCGATSVALAQTRTRSLREEPGAHPGPSLDMRDRQVPTETTIQRSGPRRPAPAATAESGPVVGGAMEEGEGDAPHEAVTGHAGYGGVAPGAKVQPPHPPRSKNPTRVTWTGFQMVDG